MRLLLDVFFKQVPGQETQAELALPGTDIEQIDRVEDLSFRDVNVDSAKVFRKAMPDEDDTEVKQDP